VEYELIFNGMSRRIAIYQCCKYECQSCNYFSDFFSCEFVVEGAREDKCFFKILVMLLPIVSYEYCPKIVPFMKDD
jgi:hypothetical protein